MIQKATHYLRQIASSARQTRLINKYKQEGSIPWSKGYKLYKWSTINEILDSDHVLAKFCSSENLPPNFGWRIDERVVEYPWVFSRLSDKSSRFLDAGSVMNYEWLINRLLKLGKDITILTLAPEIHCYWYRKISYHFGDIRDLPFKDNWFDEVVSISTLEHVGMDNTGYGATTHEYTKNSYLVAAKELLRVLNIHGKLLISVPFGRYQEVDRHGKVFMQQFNSLLLLDLKSVFQGCKIQTQFFKYTLEGWRKSTEEECNALEYFNIHAAKDPDQDCAAAARSVACIEIEKV